MVVDRLGRGEVGLLGELDGRVDPLADLLIQRLELSEDEMTKLDEAAVARIDEAVDFAEESDFPSDESIYDHVYVP